MAGYTAGYETVQCDNGVCAFLKTMGECARKVCVLVMTVCEHQYLMRMCECDIAIV